jgi:hypothetical protein
MRGDQHALARAGRAGDRHLGVVGIEPVVRVELVVRIRPLLGRPAEVVIRDRRELRDAGHRLSVCQLGLPLPPELLPPVDRGWDVVRIGEVPRVPVGPRHAVDIVIPHVEQLAVEVIRVDRRGCLPRLRPGGRRHTRGDEYPRHRRKATTGGEPAPSP